MITLSFTGIAQLPHWQTIERLISESLDIGGRLTVIKRDDNGVNYRAHGNYTCVFTPEMGDDVTIKIIARRIP